MPFCHLTKYCWSNTAVDFARMHKVSTLQVSNAFLASGILVPKVIKNEIYLNIKNINYSWQESIKAELKKFTDYQAFIVLDSEEDIPTDSQKFSHHMIFDVK
jgi:hypothetical protein